MNTFDVKYYEDTALAYWVEHMPANNFRYDEILESHAGEVIEEYAKVLSFHCDMRCVMFEWGWAIETNRLDSEQTTTVETLISYNGETAVLVHRHRYGPNYDEFQPYDRDSILPVPSVVRLTPCSEQSSYHTPTSAEV